jgi:hypothetical protein
MGFGFAPSRIEVAHQGNTLSRRTTRVVEYADDQVTEDSFPLDGSEHETAGFRDMKGTLSGRLSRDGRQLVITSSFDAPFGPPGGKMSVTGSWELWAGGRQLAVRQVSSFRGADEMLLVFDRR